MIGPLMSPTTTESAYHFHLPRILCLHGGGTNARIFRAQCRALIAQLKHEFRLVFAQAPFDSTAGSDVAMVYNQWAPFKRWLRWRPEQPIMRPADIVNELDRSILDAMRQDDARGATGEWVALLGFSQGAKVGASLLYRQQVLEMLGKPPTDVYFRFGILIAGRAPIISLDPSLMLNRGLPDASHMSGAQDYHRQRFDHGDPLLQIPTIHVHGTRDKGLDLHRQLFEEFCDPRTRRLVEWDGDHRLPLEIKDVSPIANQIRQLARETEVY